MTHFKTFILSCLLALAAFPATAEEADFTVDGFGYFITSTSSLTVEVVSGPDEAVVTVPSTVVFNNRTFRVTGISNYAFINHKKLQSVDMPSITYIKDGLTPNMYIGAFTGCSNLRDVNMPAATSIGNGAFNNCDALTSVSLPAATSIGGKAFQDCDALTSVSLPAATSIGGKAFQDCDALTSVSLPAATSIGDDAFGGCDRLTSISLPAATSIGYGAFNNCDALTSVSLPAATSIGGEVFQDCDALTSVSLPAATSIGDDAFGGCDRLTSISLPAATSIGDDAFGGCQALTRVNMPAATSIGPYVFYDCGTLTSVNMPAAKYIGFMAFDGCKSLADIYVGAEPARCVASFDHVTYATATLHVPIGCASKYKAADGWKNFNFISEDYDPTDIKSTKANDVKIHTDNGSVQLTGLKEGDKVEFYSISGQLLCAPIASDGTVSIRTSEHVVICKIGVSSIKVLVK